MKKNNYIVYGIIVVVVLIGITIALLSLSVPKEAKFVSVDIETPNIGITKDLKQGQTATITVNIQNIINKTINDVYVKTKPKFSNDGEVIQILEPEKKIPIPIGAGGTSGPLQIHVRGVKVPTEEATETIIVELFVGTQSQELQELKIKMIR